MVNFSFIILTWNSCQFLEKCFHSIIRSCNEEGLSYEIIVVDNGSVDDSPEIFKEFLNNFPDNFFVEYLQFNRGTTVSRNIGLNKSRGQVICVIDSDTELRNGSLGEIFNYLIKHPNTGIIAPRLVMRDGSIQNSVKKFPTFFDKIIKIPRAVLGLNTPNNDFYDNFPFTSIREVDTAISACWFFRRGILESVGYLDENIFYSPEDLDFCLRVFKKGLTLLYWPGFVVFHDTQHISHKKPFSKVSRSHFIGLLYYFRKHGGWFSNRHLY